MSTIVLPDATSIGLEAAVSSWVKLNDPAQAAVLNSYRDSRLLSTLGLEGNVSGSTSGLVSGVSLAGSNKQRALLAADNLKKLVDSNAPRSEQLKAFSAAPWNGIATIMQMSRSAAGYNPAKLADPSADDTATQEQNRAAYNRYIDNLLNCPLIDIRTNIRQSLKEESMDFNKLVDDMAELFEGAIKEDYEAIKKSLIGLAKAALSYMTVKQKSYLFSQSVIVASERGRTDEYTIQITSSAVVMVADSRKGATTTQTDYDTLSTTLTFQTEMWPDFADYFYAEKEKDVSAWAAKMKTPVKPGFDAQTCFDKR